MSGFESVSSGQVDPHMSLAASRGGKYPNQFFDLSQQYMPPTIKELFKWCTFYYYNSPLIGAALKKVSRYPITDLIFEDQSEAARKIWERTLTKTLKLKERLMEVNLDRSVYGNSFVSLHMPFTRFLSCPQCKNTQIIKRWNWKFNGGSNHFTGQCQQCGYSGPLKAKDVPYKDIKSMRLVRWNPENIYIKHNDYTGRTTYSYSIPRKLRQAVLRGDRDIIEDLPLIVLEAIKLRKMIRFDNRNFKHLKAPTLAEQDQGWGKPLIIHVLKDLYYLYTLRRAQEAIALEHIVPFDLIYPMPNAQQDPFVHTDLGGWKTQISEAIQLHRSDPNYKAVIPIPIGMGRLGGDGKALLLSPEINYLTQTIVGGMGLPQEFLFGGLNWTGSSVSLRTLENDFIQNRSELLDLVHWIKDKIRIWMGLPDIEGIRFSDFRMADDIQKNQQLIGLNAQGKVSDQTMLTEIGMDFHQEIQKMIEEVFIRNYINDLQTKGMAKSQGESQLINYNYQQKIQDMMQRAQESANEKLQASQATGNPLETFGGGNPAEQDMSEPPGEGAQPSGGQEGGEWGQGQQGATAGGPQLPAPAGPEQGPSMEAEQGAAPAGVAPGGEAQTEAASGIESRIKRWATQLSQMEPTQARMTINELKAKMPEVGRAIEAEYNKVMGTMGMGAGGQGDANAAASSVEPNMNPLPEKAAPRRAGAV